MPECSLWPSLIMNIDVPFKHTHLSLSTPVIQRVANILKTHSVSMMIIITIILQIPTLTVIFTFQRQPC